MCGLTVALFVKQVFIYEFDNKFFIGEIYISEQTEIPVSVTKCDNLYDALFKRNVEVRILDNLWELGEAAKNSSLTYSLCCMRNAKPKPTY
jgi:hypothetical protein